MLFDLEHAKQFLTHASLPLIPDLPLEAVEGMGMPELETSRQQSLVVGSNVVSFTKGVEADVRQAITDSSLFAQLAAAKAVGTNTDPLVFFDAYFSNLVAIGWVIQAKETAEFSYKGDAFDVHEAIIGVITAFLSPIAGAAAAVIAVLNGLHKMAEDTPFITLFNKQSRRGEIGRFQFTYVYPDPEHGLMAEAMAFSLKADNTLTQVLFFKLKKGQTSLRRSTGSLSVDADAMKALRPKLSARMTAYRQIYIAGVELGDL
jgi:DNA-dependent RNA polymerase auxiliary subunit epsilon